MPAKRSSKGRVSPPDANHLRPLVVWDRLEVGPVSVQRRRLVAPYRLRRGRRSESTELIYRYEEPVFEPRLAGSSNLASMIAAQVALNYGLFSREIVFHGPFDAEDRAFIRRYTEHTAREIYAVKFLRENPFLLGDAAELPARPLQTYSQAAIRFEGESTPSASTPFAAAPERARDGYAVLSSGGKDSLLSYGLLREAGLQPHPIFVNESGRHWFSALNAYRHLRDTAPDTGRVWTNTDRVFAWMLRRMPFVRSDFASVRADIYPIRLWTVAAFLFGALPLLAKRGLGRLVIGDEFDTSQRGSYRGITHYHGLFDQSRYFDDAMSRYFAAKGWGVTPFSVLRPASELLIIKTLAERYPDLQAHQISCHATHEDQGRMRPCGKCEKCRRVVAMLTAVDADPQLCGYSEKQIRDCLASLAEERLHQEAPGAEHVTWLLKSSGRLEEGAAHPARRHPEVMKLRFDKEHSPLDTMPASLRADLYPLMLAHAEGAVKRHGSSWRRFDPLSRRSLEAPYRHDPGETASAAAPAPGRARRRPRSPTAPVSPRDVLLELLTWPEAERRLAEVDIALLPVGATEQHGPHLTLDIDSFDAARLALDVAMACADPKPVVLPLIPYGVSYHHESFAGTISISPGALARLVHEVGMSAAGHGIKKLVIINGHGGNIPTLHFAAQTINSEAHIFTCVDTGETSDSEVNALAQTPNDVHAGEIETSTTLYLRPDLVQMDKARRSVPRFSSPYLDFTSQLSVGWYGRTHKISRSGVMGDPTVASGEKGEKMWTLMVEHLVRLVEDLKSMTLDQIHQTKV